MERVLLEQYLAAQQRYDDFLLAHGAGPSDGAGAPEGTGAPEGAARPGNVSRRNVSAADREAFNAIAGRRNAARQLLQERFEANLRDGVSQATSPDRAASGMTAARLHEILLERQSLEDPLAVMADRESRQKIARQFRTFNPPGFQNEPPARDALALCENGTLAEIGKHRRPKRELKALALMVPTKDQARQMAASLEARSKAAGDALAADLTHCRFAAPQALTAETAKNMRGELAALRERAAAALLPEDRDRFEAAVREKTEPLAGPFVSLMIPAAGAGEAGLSEGEAENLRKLAVATGFNSRLFGALAKLPAQQRKDFAAGLAAGPERLDGMMRQIDGAFSDPALSDDALEIKNMLHEGRFTDSPRALSDEEQVKIAASHGLGRVMGKLRAAAMKTAAQGDQSDRGGQSEQGEQGAPDEHRKARVERLRAMPDDQFLEMMLDQESGKRDSAAMPALIQAYALSRAAQTGREASADELAGLDALKSRGVGLPAIQAAIRFDGADRAAAAESRIKTHQAIYDRSALKNRFMNFVGRAIDRDISPEKMGWREIDAISAPPGHADAEIILANHARKALNLRTAASVKFGADVGPMRLMMEHAGTGGVVHPHAVERCAEDMKTAINTAALDFDSTPLGIARKAVRAEREPRQDADVDGATLAIRFLGVEDILQRMAGCDNAAEMGVLARELQAVRGELGESKKYDPLGMAGKASRSSERERKERRQEIRGQIKACVSDETISRKRGESDDAYLDRMRENARNGLGVYERNQLRERACAALTVKGGNTGFGAKLDAVMPDQIRPGKSGVPPETLRDDVAAMRARMAERYGGMIHAGKVSSNKVPPRVREGLIDAAEVNVLRLFQEQAPPISFPEYVRRLGDRKSPERLECEQALGDAIADARFTVDGQPVRPAAGRDEADTRQRGKAFAGVLIDAYRERVETLERDGARVGPEGYLAERARAIPLLDRERMLERDAGPEAAAAMRRVEKNDSVDRLFGALANAGTSARFRRSGGATVGVSGDAAGAEVSASLGVTSKDEFVITHDEHGRYGVVVSGAVGAQLVADAGYGDALSVEVSLAATRTQGVRFSFDSQEECRQFMGGLLVAEDMTPAQMMAHVRGISTISALGAEAGISAEITPGEFIGALADNATRARNLAGGLIVPEGDRRAARGQKVVDARLAASASIGGERAVESISPTRKRITTKVKMEAGIEAEASAALTENWSAEAKYEARAIRQSALEREYEGDVLVGAKNVRTFKVAALEPSADENQAYQNRFERVERVRQLLAEYGAVNDELLQRVADMGDAEEFEFDVASEMEQSALDAYEAEPNPLRRMMMLNDRANYRANEIVMRQNPRAAAQPEEKELELEAPEDEDEAEAEDGRDMEDPASEQTLAGRAAASVGRTAEGVGDAMENAAALAAEGAGRAAARAGNAAANTGAGRAAARAAARVGDAVARTGAAGAGRRVVQFAQDARAALGKAVPVGVKLSVSADSSGEATKTTTFRARDVRVGNFAMETPASREARLAAEARQREAEEARLAAEAEAENARRLAAEAEAEEARRLAAEAEAEEARRREAEAQAAPAGIEEAAAEAAAEGAADAAAVRAEAANEPPYVSKVDGKAVDDLLRDCDFTKQGLIDHFGEVHKIAANFTEASPAQQERMSAGELESYKRLKAVADALKPIDDMFSPDKDRSEYDALPDDRARAALFAQRLDEAAAHAREGAQGHRPYPEVNNEDIKQLIGDSGLNGQDVSPDLAKERLIGNFDAVDGIVRGFREASPSQISGMASGQREAYEKRRDMVEALRPIHAIFTDKAGPGRSAYDGLGKDEQADLFGANLGAAAGRAAEGARKFSPSREAISFSDLQHAARPQDATRPAQGAAQPERQAQQQNAARQPARPAQAQGAARQPAQMQGAAAPAQDATRQPMRLQDVALLARQQDATRQPERPAQQPDATRQLARAQEKNSPPGRQDRRDQRGRGQEQARRNPSARGMG